MRSPQAEKELADQRELLRLGAFYRKPVKKASLKDQVVRQRELLATALRVLERAEYVTHKEINDPTVVAEEFEWQDCPFCHSQHVHVASCDLKELLDTLRKELR